MTADGATIALLWSISGGVLVILCIMIAITCLLVKGKYKTPRGGSTMDASMRGTGKTGTTRKAKVGHALSMDNDQYLRPRSDVHGLRPPKVPATGPPVRHSSPSSSLDRHIYDDPDDIRTIAKQSREERHYDNDTDLSGSPESSNYDKVHDYANTKAGAPRV